MNCHVPFRCTTLYGVHVHQYIASCTLYSPSQIENVHMQSYNVLSILLMRMRMVKINVLGNIFLYYVAHSTQGIELLIS